MRIASTLVGLALGLAVLPARADINIGVTLSATGPAASLGIPEKNTFALAPTTIGGQKVNYIILDDATDPTGAAKNARKLVSESNVDLLIGSSTVPTSLALVEVANETKTAMIAMAPIQPADDKLGWVFITPQTNALMATALLEHMQKVGVKTLGYIGYADPYGEGWWKEISRLAETKNIKIVASERFQRTDTAVGGQVLKILAAKPDAVLVCGSGTPSVLPQATLAERLYRGRVYQTHGSANRDFLRVGGKKVEGAVLPVGPMLVAEQLPDSHPSKKVALDYVTKYEATHGAESRSTFGGHAWDAALLAQQAIGEALKSAKPGTPEFRQAVRDALEKTRNLAATNGVFSMTTKDHTGLDARAAVLVKVEDGAWKLVK